MDRKICDGCGKEISGYFTKITVKKMVYDGQMDMLAPTLMGEHTIKEYDMCDKCTPAAIVTKAFCSEGCVLFKIMNKKGVGL